MMPEQEKSTGKRVERGGMGAWRRGARGEHSTIVLGTVEK
jgi:hypothetical protein